ncbi:MAG: hypothetical protein NVSMB17_01890 [Candidatus Dormibacteria bacterium]
MTRLVRSLLLAVLLLVAASALATASSTAAPVVTGLSAHVVSPGQDLVVSGTNFSYVGSGCVDPFGSSTVVHFTPLSGAARIDIRPATDSAHCSDGSVKVQVPPALTGAARVSVSDPQGAESNNNQVVTVFPTASVNPSVGQTGDRTALQGSGLRPGSLAPSTPVQLTVGGQTRPFADQAWTDNSLAFDPRNAGGSVVLAFSVINDFDARPVNAQQNLTPVNLFAGNYTFQPPSPDTRVIGHLSVGSPFHVAGRFLGTGGTVTFPGGASLRGQAWSSSGFDATVPAGAQPGQLTVYVDGFVDEANRPRPVAGPSIQLDPRVTATSPTSGSAGQVVRVSGYNLGSAPGQARVGATDEPVLSWGDQAVSLTLAPDTDGGPVTLVRADGTAVNAAVISIVPRLDRVENNAVQPGAQVVVDGASLGSGTGTVTIGGTDAQPLLWSRTSVLLQLPPALGPGTYPLQLASASGAHSNALSVTVVTPPATAPVGPSGGPGRPPAAAPPPGGVLAPSFNNNHDFVKPIKPPSPVYFNITTDPHKVRAGETADVVVVLKLNDKPLAGAQVKLAMLFTPGPDYSFSPESGVTDATGTFRSRVKVSRISGDSVVGATSGIFTDQDHVQGTGADGKVALEPTLTNPAAHNRGFAPLALVGAFAVALVIAGFYLNMRSMSTN